MEGKVSSALNVLIGAAFSLSIIAHASGYSDFNAPVVLVWVGLSLALGALFQRTGVLTHVLHPRRSAAVNAFFLVGCIVASAVLYQASPVRSTVFPRKADLVVAYEGRNPQSKGDEIWARVVLPGDVALRTEATGAGWERKDDETALSASANTSGNARWRVPLHRDAALRLTRHPWSGIARVEWNGTAHVIDLYSPVDDDAAILPLDGAPAPTLSDRIVAWLIALADTLTLALPIAFGVNMACALRRALFTTARSHPSR